MRVYWIEHDDGIKYPYVHISQFAQATNLSISTARKLLERDRVPNGLGGISKRRPVHFFRDGSTLWIPVCEIAGYPFLKGTNVYHCREDGTRYLCETCTFTSNLCEPAKIANDFSCPVGDP